MNYKVKTPFMRLYEELNTLSEDYVLEALGYKVGDFIEYESIKYNEKTGKNETIYRHGVVLQLFIDNGHAKLIGTWQLDGYGIADINVKKITKKISVNDLTPEEKTNYNKYGKQAVERQLKELKVDNAEEEKLDRASACNDAKINTKAVEPKNAKLNRARQNNSKIIKAFKEVGLSADDLVVTATNKNGKNYIKASDKLNKLRKTLFGESFDEDENPFDQEF